MEANKCEKMLLHIYLFVINDKLTDDYLVLVLFLQITIADHEYVDLTAHETPKRILWPANNRLPAHVETGVDQHRTPGSFFESM